MESLSKRKLRASVAINGRVCEGPGEPVARAMRDGGWEFVGHGYAQAALHTVADQRATIQQTFAVLHKYTGTPPRGWLGPGLQETLDTLGYLAEAGVKYVFDWPMDEKPVMMRTAAGPMVALHGSFALSSPPTTGLNPPA